jgi:hypothetical protein
MEFIDGPRNVKISKPGGGPLKFQVTRARCINVEEWSTLDLEVTEEELNTWLEFEEISKPHGNLPWSSKVRDGRLKIKIDDRTMFFDSNSKLTSEVNLVGATVSVLIEIKSVYNFKGYSGLTCRAHQIKVYGSGWMGV